MHLRYAMPEGYKQNYTSITMLIIKETLTGTVLAAGQEGSHARVFEGNWYFSPDVVDTTYLRVTERTYRCPYKGLCYWIDLQTPNGEVQNVGWVYTEPLPDYEFIKDQIAFYARDTAGTSAEMR